MKAIYEEDLQLDGENGNHSVLIRAGEEGNELTASFEVCIDESRGFGLFKAAVALQFIFPSDYPGQSPPVFEIK